MQTYASTSPAASGAAFPPATGAPNQPTKKKGKFPLLSFFAAIAAMLPGMMSFLIAGFRGHSAGWELMAIPTLITFGLAAVAGIGALVACARGGWLGGLFTIAIAAFASLLAAVGFVLGA